MPLVLRRRESFTAVKTCGFAGRHRGAASWHGVFEALDRISSGGCFAVRLLPQLRGVSLSLVLSNRTRRDCGADREPFETAQSVGERGDYSLRATKTTGVRSASWSNSFNECLLGLSADTRYLERGEPTEG